MKIFFKNTTAIAQKFNKKKRWIACRQNQLVMFIIRGDTPPPPALAWPYHDVRLVHSNGNKRGSRGHFGDEGHPGPHLFSLYFQRCLSARAARPSNTTIAEKTIAKQNIKPPLKRALIIQLQPVQIIFKLNCIRNELIQNCILSVKNEAQCVVSFASRSVGRSALQIANAIEAKRGRHVYTTRK